MSETDSFYEKASGAMLPQKDDIALSYLPCKDLTIYMHE